MVGRASGVRTKVLSKDEWLRILLLMLPRGVEDYGAVVNRARLLVWPIVPSEGVPSAL